MNEVPTYPDSVVLTPEEKLKRAALRAAKGLTEAGVCLKEPAAVAYAPEGASFGKLDLRSFEQAEAASPTAQHRQMLYEELKKDLQRMMAGSSSMKARDYLRSALAQLHGTSDPHALVSTTIALAESAETEHRTQIAAEEDARRKEMEHLKKMNEEMVEKYGTQEEKERYRDAKTFEEQYRIQKEIIARAREEATRQGDAQRLAELDKWEQRNNRELQLRKEKQLSDFDKKISFESRENSISKMMVFETVSQKNLGSMPPPTRNGLQGGEQYELGV